MHMFEMWKMSIPVHLHMSVCMRRKSDTGSEAAHTHHTTMLLLRYLKIFLIL